jgi:hypothetical protein
MNCPYHSSFMAGGTHHLGFSDANHLKRLPEINSSSLFNEIEIQPSTRQHHQYHEHWFGCRE